jgi:hypothetical protein
MMVALLLIVFCLVCFALFMTLLEASEENDCSPPSRTPSGACPKGKPEIDAMEGK